MSNNKAMVLYSFLLAYMTVVISEVLYTLLLGDFGEVELVFLFAMPILFLLTPFLIIPYYPVNIVFIFGYVVIAFVCKKRCINFYKLYILAPLFLGWLVYGFYCFGKIGAIS